MSLPAYAMNVASFPEMYERRLVGPLFRPFAEATLDGVAVASAESVIDVACGTGIVARVARERYGPRARIVGVDVSPPMLAVASAVAPDIEWRVGDAAALPLGDQERFALVVCQQGLQFFPDKEAALRELRRASAPGARIAVAVWCATSEMPLLRDLQTVAERHLGAIDDQRYAFGDAARLQRMLIAVGFGDASVDRVARMVRFAVGAEFVQLNAMAFAGMSAAARAMNDEARAAALARIVEDSKAVLPAGGFDGPLEFQMVTNLAVARA